MQNNAATSLPLYILIIVKKQLFFFSFAKTIKRFPLDKKRKRRKEKE